MPKFRVKVVRWNEEVAEVEIEHSGDLSALAGAAYEKADEDGLWSDGSGSRPGEATILGQGKETVIL